MSGKTRQTQRLIASSLGLKSVVRTMKAMAAVSVGPYERALHSLDTSRSTIESALSAVLRHLDHEAVTRLARPKDGLDVIIAFGSDQGMVGAFNERLARVILDDLQQIPVCVTGSSFVQGRPRLWTVGERLHNRLETVPAQIIGPFPVPESLEAVPSLMSRLLSGIEREQGSREIARLTVYFNRPALGAGFEPTVLRVLPFDSAWLRELGKRPWPTKSVPQLVGGTAAMLGAVLREHLFLALFEASVRSGASEHATRLAAMMRAEKSIDERLDSLQREFHAERQNAIMDELFDIIAGRPRCTA